MFAQMKHLAIVSDNLEGMSRFYERVFGMKGTGVLRAGALVVGDGYVGLNINPRVPGRQAGFDHFGFEVQDVELVYSRLRTKYPEVRILQRLSNRPFAGVSTHDPAGNVFDLSQQNMENRGDAYVEADREQKRHVKHLALRAVDPAGLAKFYRNVFELAEMEKPADDPNFYLSDGKVVFVIMPWDITDFAGTGIERPALDHIGFKVESVATLKTELEKVKRERAVLAPNPTGADAGPEGEARLKLFAKCPLGQFHMADPDGVLIDVTDR